MVPIPFLTPHAEKEDSLKVEQKCHFFCFQRHFAQVAARRTLITVSSTFGAQGADVMAYFTVPFLIEHEALENERGKWNSASGEKKYPPAFPPF